MKGAWLYGSEERADILSARGAAVPFFQTFQRAEIFNLLRATEDMCTQTPTFSKVNEQVFTWGEDAKQNVMTLQDKHTYFYT